MSQKTVRPMVGGVVTPLVAKPKKSGSAEVKSSECVEKIVVVCELLGFRPEGFKPRGTEQHHAECIRRMGGDWMGFYKYKIASWVAACLEQELPTQPRPLAGFDTPGELMGSTCGRWMKLMRRPEHAGAFDSLIASMMTVKRAFPRPTKAMMDRKILETAQDLTRKVKVENWKIVPKPHPGVENEKDTLERSRGMTGEEREFRRNLENMVDQLFDGKAFEPSRDMVEPFFPSTNANYITTRGNGGAVGHLMNSELMAGLLRPDGTLIHQEEGMGLDLIDDSKLVDLYGALIERIIEGAMQEEKKVTLVALAEALKIRIISKGPVLTYTCLKPLQKWLWKTLVQDGSGAFKLIGEEITGEYLRTQLGPLREDESYMSGDYKAAKDNLKPWVSETITRRIGEKCIKDRRIRQLFTAALTGHQIVVAGEAKPQTYGQLMGSIVSFPILCIANATIVKMAREESTQRQNLSLKAARVAINGDDCVMRLNPRGKAAWERWAHISGMEPSLGKCFFSRKFLNMNSAQFKVEYRSHLERPSFLTDYMSPKLELDPETGLELHLRRVPFINMGLVVGQGRTTSGKLDRVKIADWGTINSISSNAHTLVGECRPEDKLRVFKKYLNHNWELLNGGRDAKTGKLRKLGLPWFLPEHLGGLGLPTFPDHKVEGACPYMPTEVDLRMAAVIHKHGKLPAKRPEGVAWKVWDYALRRLKDFRFVKDGLGLEANREIAEFLGRDSDIIAVSEKDVAGKLCIEAMFTQPFNRMYVEAKERNLTLRAVEREVRRCLRSREMQNVQPYTYKNMPSAPEPEEEAGALKVTTRAYVSSSSLLEE